MAKPVYTYTLRFVSQSDDYEGFEHNLVFSVTREHPLGATIRGQVTLSWPCVAVTSGNIDLSDIPDILKGLFDAHKNASDHARLSAAFEDPEGDDGNRHLAITFEV